MKEELRHIVHEHCVDYILQRFPTLKQLSMATEQELVQIPGIGPAKAKEITAIFKLSRQLVQSEAGSVLRIKTPGDAYIVFRDLALLETEHVYALFLDTKNQVISRVMVSAGTINSSLIHPREFYSTGVRIRAAAVIAAHNHPSGDPTPSKEDIDVTRRLVDSGRILGVELLDHIIIGGDRHCSMREKGLI